MRDKGLFRQERIKFPHVIYEEIYLTKVNKFAKAHFHDLSLPGGTWINK